MRWFFCSMVTVVVATGCAPFDSEAVGESAREAAVAYADGSYGLATGGVWLESGSEATDVYVSGDGACAAVLVQFEPDTLAFVVVLASLDHFTIAEVLEEHSHEGSYDLVGVSELVGDRRWAPTFDVPFGGPTASLEPYRDDIAVFDRSCETVHNQ